MKKNDGYEGFRYKESQALSDLVQRRFHFLQNPSDCSTARKLVCKINKGCGLGCQLHHIVYCFIMAYATERTLILKSKGWRYHKGGWEEIYLPVSETCLDSEGQSQGSWPSQDVQVMTVPIIDSLNPRPSFLPLAIPADLAPRLMRIHGDPIAWWIGQLLKFILKPQPETAAMLENGKNKLGFKRPIVGVHVRRTDKVGTEAAFHGIDEYMKVSDLNQPMNQPQDDHMITNQNFTTIISHFRPSMTTTTSSRWWSTWTNDVSTWPVMTRR
jgi:glycoprotein 6-alpha-L-fucosyltransferase